MPKAVDNRNLEAYGTKFIKRKKERKATLS